MSEYLGKMSLFALIGASVVGSVIFIAVYGIMRAPEAEYTTIAVGVVTAAASAIVGAVVALLKSGDA